MTRIIALCSILLLLVPFTTLAQVDFCEGNFDYDRDQDGTDALTFKSDFGRSGIINPCPIDGPAPVPKTGQTLCYNSAGEEIACQICIPPHPCIRTGQDGNWRKGIEWPDPRFTDNSNGTVTDNLTGLIWLKNANCFGVRTWQDALDYSNNLSTGECGLTDRSNAGEWRLPNRFELESLLDMGNTAPALPLGHPFTNVQAPFYWSSTTNASDYSSAWGVRMWSGYLSLDDKAVGNYVWPVRGGY